ETAAGVLAAVTKMYQTEIEKRAGMSSGHCEEPQATRQSPVYWSKGGGEIASLRSQYPVLDRPRVEV
ncbi:MAG: hypothetical protein ACWGSD_10195, partial [Thermodesulfobacteriota bacterium]